MDSLAPWFTATPASLVAIALSAVGVYTAVLVYTRLSGLRSFAKMSSFDFAMTVAIGSMLASSILNQKPTFPQALVGIAMVYALQRAVGWARERWTWVQTVVDNEPLLLMDGPTMLRDHMKEASVTEDDLWGKLREANVLDLAQVRAVVMETTGDITVLHGEAGGTPLEGRLLTGVRGADRAVRGNSDLRPGTELTV